MDEVAGRARSEDGGCQYIPPTQVVLLGQIGISSQTYFHLTLVSLDYAKRTD